MLISGLVILLLAQADPVRRFDTDVMVGAAKSRAIDEQKRDSAGEAQREFEAKFNRMIDALQVFATEYKAAEGQVWPIRAGEQLKAALRDVERSIPECKRRVQTNSAHHPK
jgi:hypothetical protein